MASPDLVCGASAGQAENCSQAAATAPAPGAATPAFEEVLQPQRFIVVLWLAAALQLAARQLGARLASCGNNGLRQAATPARKVQKRGWQRQAERPVNVVRW